MESTFSPDYARDIVTQLSMSIWPEGKSSAGAVSAVLFSVEFLATILLQFPEYVDRELSPSVVSLGGAVSAKMYKCFLGKYFNDQSGDA